MKRAALGPSFLFCLAPPACRAPNATGAWQNLFGETSLREWLQWLRGAGSANPEDVFTVTNRQVRISGEGMGYLVTCETFRDFHPVVEWRRGLINTHPDRTGKSRDSGIFLHVAGPPAIYTMGPAHSGRAWSSI